MKNNRDLAVGLSLLLAGAIGLGVLSGMQTSLVGPVAGEMMDRNGMVAGGMMSRNGMKAMMKGMMGDILPPGIDPKLLPDPGSPGARLLEQYCTQCHDLPGPGMHTAAEWPAVVNRMNGREQMMSRGMMGVRAPGAAELGILMTYLQAHAQRPLAGGYPDLDSPAGRAFRATCAQCHALPDPAQHTADAWPGVVDRMRRNMSVMGKPVPDEATIGEIVGFLQHHARERAEAAPVR